MRSCYLETQNAFKIFFLKAQILEFIHPSHEIPRKQLDCTNLKISSKDNVHLQEDEADVLFPIPPGKYK